MVTLQELSERQWVTREHTEDCDFCIESPRATHYIRVHSSPPAKSGDYASEVYFMCRECNEILEGYWQRKRARERAQWERLFGKKD